jgi:hypothetical protein
MEGKEMTEETNWKQFLTENVLHEVWHEPRITENSRCSCGRPYHLGTPYDHCNRRYDNELDMMELYRHIYKYMEWSLFASKTYARVFVPYCNEEDIFPNDFMAWLFCLDGADYESKCKMIAEFYGYEEKK